MGDRVKAYRRLTGPDSDVVKWSLMDQRSGLVVAHADEAALTDVVFQVRESGRQQVIKSGRKNVHAFAVGRLAEGSLLWEATGVHYNPERAGHFYDDAGKPVVTAARAHLDAGGKLWARR